MSPRAIEYLLIETRSTLLCPLILFIGYKDYWYIYLFSHVKDQRMLRDHVILQSKPLPASLWRHGFISWSCEPLCVIYSCSLHHSIWLSKKQLFLWFCCKQNYWLLATNCTVSILCAYQATELLEFIIWSIASCTPSRRSCASSNI